MIDYYYLQFYESKPAHDFQCHKCGAVSKRPLKCNFMRSCSFCGHNHLTWLGHPLNKK